MSNASATELAHDRAPVAWRATLSGLCASLVGIGLARFAYTPLLPAIISAHWFAAPDAAYLGAANLAGYLAGALIAVPLSARLPAPALLRAMMLLATAAFFACSWPADFTWFFVWRFLAGLAGGVIMVLAATTVLPHVAAARRGLASGAIFAGVGFGIAASGTLVPLLLEGGLSRTWVGLGILSLLLTLVAWGGWPRAAASVRPPHPAAALKHPTLQLRALYAEYALNAVGLVPHMIFLVDFVARGLGRGLAAGSEYWVLFGLGAILGPLITGRLADRTGFGPALRLAFFIEAIAIALPVLGTGTAGLIASSLVVGALTPGIVPLVLGRVHEMLEHHPAAQKAAWSRATTSFAIFQALSAYGMSYLFVGSGANYMLLFGLGSAALVLAFLVDLVVAVTARGARKFA